MSKSQIWSDVDFDKEGVQNGFLRLPTSRHESAYGSILIPVASIRNGGGPRVIVVAGNHGDEYEGQIVVMNLMRTLRHDEVRGHIVLLSALNAPAVYAGRRTSPYDGGNLNRVFPGRPDGGPTEAIAHFFETTLLPGADLVVDLHSGGSSLEYIPSAVIVNSAEQSRLRKLLALLRIFGFPVSFVTDAPSGPNRGLAAACERAGGIPCLSSELGGGGTVSIATLKLAEEATRRVLEHIGSIRSVHSQKQPAPIALYRRVPFRDFVFAPCGGVFEPMVQLGEFVDRGSDAGLIHNPTEPWAPPRRIQFAQAGLVLCRRFTALTAPGDCLFNVGIPFTEADQ